MTDVRGWRMEGCAGVEWERGVNWWRDVRGWRMEGCEGLKRRWGGLRGRRMC